MDLWKGLESVGDATDEADGNEDNEERGETAEDDARRISVLAPLAENHCVWGFIKVIGCEDQLSSAYQHARYKVSLDKGNATLPLRAATNDFENIWGFFISIIFRIGTHRNFFTP